MKGRRASNKGFVWLGCDWGRSTWTGVTAVSRSNLSSRVHEERVAEDKSGGRGLQMRCKSYQGRNELK